MLGLLAADYNMDKIDTLQQEQVNAIKCVKDVLLVLIETAATMDTFLLGVFIVYQNLLFSILVKRVPPSLILQSLHIYV